MDSRLITNVEIHYSPPYSYSGLILCLIEDDICSLQYRRLVYFKHSIFNPSVKNYPQNITYLHKYLHRNTYTHTYPPL